MHFSDEEAVEVKAWVVKKLEDMYADLYPRNLVRKDKDKRSIEIYTRLFLKAKTDNGIYYTDRMRIRAC